MAETQPETTPIWKRWWVIAIAVVIVVGGIGSAVAGDEEEPADVAASPTPTQTTEQAPDPIEEPEPTETAAPAPEPSETEEPVEAEPETDFWELAPIGNGDVIKDYVDESAAAGDCAALQETFDTWANADHVQDFTPSVLEYIDTALSEAGCY